MPPGRSGELSVPQRPINVKEGLRWASRRASVSVRSIHTDHSEDAGEARDVTTQVGCSNAGQVTRSAQS
jgi:hypothetical protein